MTTAEQRQQEAEARAQRTKEEAVVLARVFLGNDDGKRALAILRARCGSAGLCFARDPASGRYDTIAAAIREGERRIGVEIEAALKSAAPEEWAKSLI